MRIHDNPVVKIPEGKSRKRLQNRELNIPVIGDPPGEPFILNCNGCKYLKCRKERINYLEEVSKIENSKVVEIISAEIRVSYPTIETYCALGLVRNNDCSHKRWER